MWIFINIYWNLLFKISYCVYFVLFIGDYGGSILFLLYVINEFLEYGIMEESGESLRVFFKFDVEFLLCCL